jgi:glutamate racemase
MNNHPIGILDSGVGGLTVLQAVVQELPHESIVYIGDSKNTPYGVKSSNEIYTLAKRMIEFLLAKKVKLIVIACNTITVSCLDRLRIDYPEMPIIGTVPVVKTAVAVTQNKRIGILSTTSTAKSDYQKHLIEKFATDCTVFNYGNDELVPLIERGKGESDEMGHILKKVLRKFQDEKIDTLVLGCTHFPFLEKQMNNILGSQVQLVESGGAVARQVRRVLEQNKNLAEEKSGEVKVYTTGNMHIAKNLVVSTIEKRLVTVQQITIEDDK